MLKGLKPWRFLAAFLLGLAIGGAAGAWFQSEFLDKPETVMEIGKQKIKGEGNRGLWGNKQESSQGEDEEDEDDDNGGWWIFGKSKDKED